MGTSSPRPSPPAREPVAALEVSLPLSAPQLQAQSRAELVEQERRDKIARLWPERESPLVQMVNGFVERGLLEGAERNRGANGSQFVLGGMRSGQGMSVGVGYRRSDIFRDFLGYRATVRGTPQLAWMADFELDFQKLKSDRSRLWFYAKYEYSPQMDFYGFGPSSEKENRTSYRWEDFGFELVGDLEVFRNFRIGAQGGFYWATTGKGSRGGVPSTEELFQDVLPEFGLTSRFYRFGGTLQYDWRDIAGAARSGGNYFVRAMRYRDVDLNILSFWQLDAVAEQYFPYFNKTRVVAFRVWAKLTGLNDQELVPFYLQAKLGGNDDLRGYDRYRFYDNNMILATLEHRWHGFSGMDVALFVDGGQVAEDPADFKLTDWRWNGGIGFRFKVQEYVIMRIDTAYGDEGLRFMWTFSDIFGKRPR